MKALLDTSVLVAAFRSRHGASNRILQIAAEGRFGVLCSPALFLEYEDVLKRPEQRAVHGMTERTIDLLMRDLADLIEPVEVHFRWRPQLSDANDEMVLEAALNGRAECLVTHNEADFRAAAQRFRLKVKRPKDFLKEMER